MASTSRWATPDEGSSRSTTVGAWATTAARSTSRRVPVDSSLDEFVGEPLEAEQFDQLIHPGRHGRLGVDHRPAAAGRR